MGNTGSVILCLYGNDLFLSVGFLRLFKPFLICKAAGSHGHVGVDDHIVLSEIRVQRGGSLSHGCFYGDNGLVLLVRHLDQTRRLGSGNLVFSHNGRNIIPIQPDAFI